MIFWCSLDARTASVLRTVSFDWTSKAFSLKFIKTSSSCSLIFEQNSLVVRTSKIALFSHHIWMAAELWSVNCAKCASKWLEWFNNIHLRSTDPKCIELLGFDWIFGFRLSEHTPGHRQDQGRKKFLKGRKSFEFAFFAKKCTCFWKANEQIREAN